MVKQYDVTFLSFLRDYASTNDLVLPGSAWQLRPWQLPFMEEFGLRGTSDPDRVSVTFRMCFLSKVSHDLVV